MGYEDDKTPVPARVDGVKTDYNLGDGFHEQNALGKGAYVALALPTAGLYPAFLEMQQAGKAHKAAHEARVAVESAQFVNANPEAITAATIAAKAKGGKTPT